MKKIALMLAIFIGQIAFAQVQTEYYANGKKKSEGEYAANNMGTSSVMASDGSSRQVSTQTKQGAWSYWYDSGSKRAEENYTNGVTKGVWKTWYPDGSLSSEINYTSGKATFWYQNGKKQSEGDMLENRVFNGKWTAWFENGLKSYEGSYNQGKKDGIWNWFDETGKQVSRQTYKNDELIDTQKL